jgi:hypothetical protein
MAGLSFLAFALPVGRSFYDLHLPSAAIVVQSVLLGAAAALVVEVTTRVSARIRSHRADSRGPVTPATT